MASSQILYHHLHDAPKWNHLHITHKDYSRKISTYSTRLLFAKVTNVRPTETLNVKRKTFEAMLHLKRFKKYMRMGRNRRLREGNEDGARWRDFQICYRKLSNNLDVSFSLKWISRQRGLLRLMPQQSECLHNVERPESTRSSSSIFNVFDDLVWLNQYLTLMYKNCTTSWGKWPLNLLRHFNPLNT